MPPSNRIIHANGFRPGTVLNAARRADLDEAVANTMRNLAHTMMRIDAELKAQAAALDAFEAGIAVTKAKLDTLDFAALRAATFENGITSMSFLDRLRWLFTGRLP